MTSLSNLTATTTLSDDDLVYAVDGSNSRKVTWANVKVQFGAQRIAVDPITNASFDLGSSDLHSQFYGALGTFTIAAGNKVYINHYTGTNNSTGNGELRAFSWELTAGANATGDSVRGAIGSVSSSGAANVKSVHGTAEGLTGHTGVLVGVVGQCIPVGTTSESYGFQGTIGDGSTAGIILNPINDGDDVNYGILHDPGTNKLEVLTAFIRYYTHGSSPGDFLSMRNSADSADVYKVTSAGVTLAAAGSASAPAYSFHEDTDLGWYRSAANEASLSCGNQQTLIAGQSSFEVRGNSSDTTLTINSNGDSTDKARLDLRETSSSGGFIEFDGSDNDLDFGTHQSSTDYIAFWLDRGSTTVNLNGLLKAIPITVASLPAAGTAGSGARSFVSDANATTFASVVAGGGSNPVPVYSDGTNWRIG